MLMFGCKGLNIDNLMQLQWSSIMSKIINGVEMEIDDNFIAIRGMYIYLCDQSVLVNKVFLFLQTKEHSSFKILINVINSLKC